MALTEAQFSVCIVELDVNDDYLCVWIFPSMAKELQAVAINRCSTDVKVGERFFTKYKTDWLYIGSKEADKDVAPDVKAFHICITSKIFSPTAYSTIINVLTEQYYHSADPTKVLEGYLSLVTTGKFANAVGTASVSGIKEELRLSSTSSLLELSQNVGLEFVLLWNAVLLQKRILILATSVEQAYTTINSLLLMSPNKVDFSIVKPIVRNDPYHLEDLSSSGVFIAGTLDETLVSLVDRYDVLLSIPDSRVTVAAHAQQDMSLCAIHKEVAKIISEGAESGLSEEELIKEIKHKTDSVLDNLKGLAEELSAEIIDQQISNKSASKWLTRLAVSCGLIRQM